MLDAVFLDNLDPQDDQERMEYPELPVSLVSPGSPDVHQQSARTSPRSPADHAHLDLPDLLDPPDLPETLVAPDSLVETETPEDRDNPDPEDPLDPVEILAEMVFPERPDVPRLLSPAPPGTQDVPETPDDKVLLETQDQMADPETTELPDQKEPLVPPVHLETPGQMANPDRLELPGLQEKGESAPNTVPSTVEFSSRTEHEDKGRLATQSHTSGVETSILWVVDGARLKTNHTIDVSTTFSCQHQFPLELLALFYISVSLDFVKK